MTVYVITSKYFEDSFFGIYFTIKRARKALERFFFEEDEITSFEDIGDYCYQFTTMYEGTFTAQICADVIDAEYTAHIVQGDE